MRHAALLRPVLVRPSQADDAAWLGSVLHLPVYADGGICLDILQNNWSPIYDVSAVLTSIQSLLCDPNPNSPANSEAARMYTECRREYDKRVQVRRHEAFARRRRRPCKPTSFN